MTKDAKPNVAPVIGEIAKVMAVTGLTVAHTTDGEWITLKLPIDMPDGRRLVVGINHAIIDEVVKSIVLTVQEAAGVRARRAAES